MKTFLRLVRYALPLGGELPLYIVYAFFGVIFGLLNFTLFIPLLNLLFSSGEANPVTTAPVFSADFTYIKDLFSYHFNKIMATQGKVSALQVICIIIFISVALSNVFRFLSQKILTSVRTRLVKNLRAAVYNQVTDADLRFFYLKNKGQLVSVFSNDIHEVENSVVSSLQVIIREPLMLTGFFFLLFSLSVKLTLFTLVLLPLSFLLIAEITKRLKRDALKGQEFLGNIMGLIDETISGIRIIKGFNNESFIKKRFDKENESYRKMHKSVVNKRELASPLSEFMGVSVLTLVFYYGGSMVLDHKSELSASEFITYIILYSQVLIPAKNISTAVTNIQKGLVSGNRILEIIDTPRTIVDNEKAGTIKEFRSEIRFKEVGFSHGDFEVLTGVNFVLPKGQTVALVGPSGAGKSTLADLLPRFYEVTRGEILVDGVPISDITLHSLRNLMGIVTQDSILFNESVAFNIAFGDENPDRAKIEEAARVANAHEFIAEMENGYDTNIGDRGGKLSGGQRQRLSIARAVYKNPPILILDEATSALDTESEKLVQEALAGLMKNRTTLVIAHRLSTIRHADDILVLDKGRMVERGNHQKLFEQKGLYRKLCDMQAFS